MKFRVFILVIVSFFAFQCKQKEKEVKGEFSFAKKKEESKGPKASETINLVNKGIGPIDSITLNAEIDSAMVSRGKKVYADNCTLCHKVGSTFIGPPPNGILKRRSPEWVMNMILNPTEMIKKDSVAKALFMEFNGQLMTDQEVSEAEARDILEYFRTLE